MKALFKFSFLTVMIVAISCTGCKKDDGDGDDNPDTSGTLTASITPAKGWEKNDAVVPTWMNKDGRATGATIILTTDNVPSSVKTANEYVTFAQTLLKSTFKDAVFSAASNTKVGGKDAVEYTYTTTVTLDFKFRMVYILIGSKAYTIQCCALASDYNAVAADFQSMIDSYTLK